MNRSARTTRLFLLMTLASLFLFTTSDARTWHIKADGTGDAPTIQAAIEGATSGDEILVAPGTYLENLDYLGKEVALRSEKGPEVTIIDGSAIHAPVVRFVNEEGAGAILEGFTITGGRGQLRFGTNPWGGGIYAPGAGPVIRGNHIIRNETIVNNGSGGGMMIWGPALIEGNLFESNVTSGNGGGLSVGGDGTVVSGNLFRGNVSRFDGGAVYMYVTRGSATLIGNEFFDNTAGDHGGGIEAYTAVSDPLCIERNLFIDNIAHGSDGVESGAGGAISARGYTGWIRNNTVVSNTATGRWECTGGGIFLDYDNPGFVEIRNNIIAGNSGCGLSCYAYSRHITLENNIFWNNGPTNFGFDRAECPASLSEVNLLVDPEFCSPETGDYSLKASSPGLTGEEVIGYYSEAGCPGVAVEATTWSLIKARFRE